MIWDVVQQFFQRLDLVFSEPPTLEMMGEINQAFIPLIVAGVMAAAKQYSAYKKGKAEAKNKATGELSRYQYDVLRQKQFKPFAPYASLGKGRMLAGIAKSWGMEGMLGKDFLSYISDPMNVPGTQGIGGKKDLKGIEDIEGWDAQKYKNESGVTPLSAGGNIAGSVADAYMNS